MSIKKTLVKNTSFNILGYFYLLLASFFSISIILNNLGRDLFGGYIFLLSFITLSAVFDFGVSNAVVRKLALPDITAEEKVKTWKTSFAIFIALGLLMTALVSGILYWLSHTLPLFRNFDISSVNLSIITISVIVLINHINNHFLTLPQALQRFEIFNSKTLLVGTANTILSAIVSGYTGNIGFMFLTQLFFHLLTFFYLIHYSQKTFGGSAFFPLYYPDTGKDLFSFGIKNFIGVLASQIENQFSNFMLGALSTAQSITSFSIPQNIVAKGAGVVSQFAQVFFPLSASLLTKDRIFKLKKMVIVLEGVVLLGGGVAIILATRFGEPFLLWWLKDSVVVENAYPVLKILSYYFLLVALTPIPTALLQGLNKPQIPSLFAVITVTLEIIIALILVPKFTVIGLAYTFVISAAISVPAFLLTSWLVFSKTVKSITANS